MISWYNDSQINALKSELESTTTQIAEYYGDDLNEFIDYVDNISLLSSNDLRSVIIKNGNIVDYKTKLTYIKNLDTRDIYELSFGKYYLVFIDGVYYCFAVTNLKDANDAIYIMNSCPVAVIEANLKAATRNLWITMLVSFIASIIVTYIFSKYLSKPILSVVEDAKKIGQADFNYNTKESIIEEINELQESILKTSLRLENTDKLEKEFLSGVTHELKAPITIIQSYAEMIKDFSGDNNELREEHLDIIIEQSHVMTKHINDLNIISKVKSNAYDDKQEINIFNIINKMIEGFYPNIEERKITLTLNVDQDLNVCANPLCIKYCFTNYISNAIKFAKSKILINAYKKDDKIYFSISNDGDNIHPDDISKIWNRFYKGENKGGSGLGLAIVQTICEHCGYDYLCESDNELTTFSIIIGD